MNLKTKNTLTVAILGLLALGLYIYALPDAVFEHLAKAIRAVFNG
jgi:hypothetical protein